ncbi:MAG: diaminopimelate epimerase [Rhodospirillaceae bacterium]|nr:diaminopimelate epimerase [Rhodospirillaceae bacterium]|tara:strand:+ start:503 stop:1318 length:816 start_codon:yes stop_codon:yes gene_type:complete
MDIPFIKMHGLGNDFVIIDNRSMNLDKACLNIPKIADRRRGIGFDQLLILSTAQSGGDILMEITNPDGSIAEACGNGTRCVAQLLMTETGLDTVIVETIAGMLSCNRVAGHLVTVDMGRALTSWHEIPLARDADTLNVKLKNAPFDNCTCVNIGNPHAVFFTEDCGEIPLEKVGPIIENHEIFPERTNVEFATILSPNKIRMRVWERSAGITTACGSGACAVLVAAVRKQFVSSKADVILDGGTLSVEWTKDNRVLMTGPTSMSYRGQFEV